ncbi:SigE family RNA polymerase sigma factor [Nocardioides ultimimeridianus]
MADRSEFGEYVAARRPLLHRTAVVLTGDPHQAEDLVQNVLVKLYVHWPRVARAQSVDAYVRRMLVNAATDAARRPSRRREVLGSPAYEPAVTLPDTDLRNALLTALRDLAPGQRRVVALRHWWGLSTEETAIELGISPGTVKSQTSEALRRLRQLLAEQELQP